MLFSLPGFECVSGEIGVGTFECFEEIEAWQKARVLVREVYRVSGHGAFLRDFVLRDQVRRAAVSVMSNIAEGYERGGTGEFMQFLSIAKGSAGELRSQFYAALDQGYFDQETFDRMLGLVKENSRLIAGLMNYLRKSSVRGLKYKKNKPVDSICQQPTSEEPRDLLNEQ